MQSISVMGTLLKRMGCDVSRPALVAPARRVFQVLDNHLTTSEIHVGNQLRSITLLSHEWWIESKALRTSIQAILRLRLCQWQSWVGHHAINKTILIENDPLGDWSLEKNWCWLPTFRQPVRKAPSESRLSMVLLHPAFAPICWSLINPKSLSMCLFTGPRTLAANHL